MRFLLPFTFCLLGASAHAQYNSEGEKIILDGEVIASWFINDDHDQRWRLLVKSGGHLWFCEEKIGYWQCNKKNYIVIRCRRRFTCHCLEVRYKIRASASNYARRRFASSEKNVQAKSRGTNDFVDREGSF